GGVTRFDSKLLTPFGRNEAGQRRCAFNGLIEFASLYKENPMLPLLLASSSPYRRELLSRLHLPFTCASPDIDENAQPGESPQHLVRRLAEQKARALAPSNPAHLIIGSDQVAVLDGRIIGKPHHFEGACQQLLNASNRSLTFLTG